MSMKWYILHGQSGQEKRISKAIFEQAEKANLSHLIEDIVIPTEEITEVRRGKKQNVQKKFLPGYILVKMNFSDQLWHTIKSISKMGRFLGSNGKPHMVPDSEVEQVFKQMQEGATLSIPGNTFQNGESIRVKEGPFESFTGTVVDVDQEKKRLKVSVSIFGRSTPVELEYTQVEKL